MTSPTFSQAIQGWLLTAETRRLSEHTIADYQNTFRRFRSWLKTDRALDTITAKEIGAWLASCSDVGGKTALNYHTALSALWQWATVEGLVNVNLVRSVPRPSVESRAIVPFTRDDVVAMLAACDKSETMLTHGKRYTHRNPMAIRNRAMLLLMLDTGLRASELCGLKIRHLDQRNKSIKVYGKGKKERVINFSPATGQAIWRYLATRAKDSVDDWLFVTDKGGQIDRVGLLHLIERIGDRAHVEGAHPHRFRHTFAINFLNNGGNVYALQMMLGHTTLKMCQTYLQIAQADAAAAQKVASPVANWNL